MKTSLLICLSLLTLAPSSYAQEEDCDPKDDPSKRLLTALGASPEGKIKDLADATSDYKVLEHNRQPSQVTPISVSYDLGRKRVNPGECVYLQIPEHLTKRPILFANLGHTQMGTDTGYDHEKKWDANPGLTTVQLNQAGQSGSAWRYWNGPSSGDYGAKFAENDRMELEGLYEWYKYGHNDVATKTNSKNLLMVDGARLCSMGTDPVTIGSFAIKVAPEVAKEYQEVSFSNGHKMGDMVTAQGRNYGSRSDALFLDRSDSSKLPKDWKLSSGSLRIPAKEGMELNSFEVTIGDSRSDGSPGGSSLNVMIQKANGTRVPIIERENVPPEGVLLGAPFSKVKLEKGDEIVVSAWGSYVMGVRMGYSDFK
jgi:hypothetical protein